ncbi:hypothetical protein DEO72_LG1g3131 [Vigna unguiculata]|uniref:Uncharacterized protein n=1 Tax=Vigna unguiculata TaxID=3917 RepID=A0A4D6KW04_VIGUN|nr:hypothetical protein DEO72_LG1g3131 [Vigna unguiculata]
MRTTEVRCAASIVVRGGGGEWRRRGRKKKFVVLVEVNDGKRRTFGGSHYCLNGNGSKVREWRGGGLQGSRREQRRLFGTVRREKEEEKRVSRVSKTQILDRFW